MSDRPEHVAYVLSRFPQISETFILREMTGLEERGHRVTVVAAALDGSPVRQPGAQHFIDGMIRPQRLIDVIGAQLWWLRRSPRRYLTVWRDAIRGNLGSAKFLSRALLMVPFAALAARRLRDTDVTRLHAHYASHALLCAWAMSRLTGLPYGVTCHAHDLYVDRTMLREKLEGASLIVTISEFNRRLIAQTCGDAIAARTRIVHCGVDTTDFQPVSRSPRTGPTRFLMIGSMQPYKGHVHAIEALALLAAAPHQIDAELVLVGDGELSPSLVSLADELGVGDRTRFVGRLTAPEVRTQLLDADCVLQPSIVTAAGKMEGIPVALMEALACERPVIASELSGVSELVRAGETGVLVPPGDAVALAAAMADVIAEPHRHHEMAVKGRRLVEDEFDLDRQIDQLEALFSGRAPERTMT